MFRLFAQSALHASWVIYQSIRFSGEVANNAAPSLFLRDSGIDKRNVPEVVLVDGFTRIPKVDSCAFCSGFIVSCTRRGVCGNIPYFVHCFVQVALDRRVRLRALIKDAMIPEESTSC